MTDDGENSFWRFFDEHAEQLGFREVSFRKIFEHLDKIATPITILETGCARLKDNWTGDGQSTILFDHYVTARGNGSKVYSVDLDPKAVEVCKTQVSKNVEVFNADGVTFLYEISHFFIKNKIQVNFLYLDSFDADMTNWYPSAAHHLKELLAAFRCVTPSTLVVVDDSPRNVNIYVGNDGQHRALGEAVIAGKGRLIAEFAAKVSADLMFSHYQAGWTGFNKEP